MAVRKSSWLSLHAVIALFAVFLAPAVDAAACAPETTVITAHMVDTLATSDNDDRDDAGERNGEHGVCSHGHCHHGSTGPVDSSTETVKLTLSEERPPFVEDYQPSYASEGLKRPPKA